MFGLCVEREGMIVWWTPLDAARWWPRSEKLAQRESRVICVAVTKRNGCLFAVAF